MVGRDQRAELMRRLEAMPALMRERPQWLLWRFGKTRPGAKKPPKVPYYANGHLRGWPYGRPRDGEPTEAQPQVPQGHALDRTALVSLETVLKRLAGGAGWEGVGFAFLPDDGFVGIDIDHAIDAASGEVSPLCSRVIELCGSYTELSQSGTGVHVICTGQTPTFKDDAIGLEVYCGSQYFICTGQRWHGASDEVKPIDPLVLSYLRELVDESRAAHAAAKAIAAAPAAAVARPMPAPAGGDEFKRVNAAAMAALGAWVPALFPGAIERGGRYRLTSKMLGRDLQEDLSIRPDGIVDFGVHDLGDANEGRRTPIDLVVEWGHKTPKDALHWLAGLLGITLSAPPRRQRPARAVPPPPPDDGDAPKDESPPDEADNVIPIGRAKRARAPGKGEGAKPAAKKKVPKDVWELVDALCERFVLIYSTDQAWDRAELMIVRIAAMRLAFGKVPVNLWLSRSTRQMIRPIDLVFEPGQEPAPPAVNMFGGLALQPQACADAEVAPMLDLLRHLCSESVLAPQPAGGRPEGAADDVDAVMHWVLCWIALPLQRLGTKMATACVFHGAQGTGKNAFWDVWRDLFGVYGITVSQTELEDKFNAWVSRKLAIIGDEVVSRQEMYHNKNRLKLIVTQQDKFPIRGMQQETRWESNHANVVFLSNESQPLALEERDRRYMVIYTPLEADAALYETAKAFRASGGAAKWLHYLLHYPVGDFGAHTKPLMTQAKEDLIRAAWKPAVQFANDWLEGLIELPVRVCSVEQLYRAFRRWCDNTGAKWPPDQAGFTGEVNRWVRERVRRLPNGQYEEPRLIYKPIALAADGLRHRRTVRCWLPTGTGAPNGVSEGQWALESVEQFERDLRTYCRPRGLATEEES